jgi:beta-phosphoglucomutase-like phosphatase (HAD superfamily)
VAYAQRIVALHALLLDLDGTLIESERLQADALAHCLAPHGLALSREERDFVVGHAWQEIYKFCAIEARLGWDLPQLINEAFAARKQLEAAGDGVRIIPGGAALVDLANSHGVPVAIVSGSSRREVEHAVDLLGIGGGLRFVIAAEDVARGKPAPDGFLLAAQRLGVSPRSCVVVEDSDAGIASALAAGMPVIATRAGLPSGGVAGAREHQRASRVVDDLRAIDWTMLSSLCASPTPVHRG